jgi:protein-glutamine gamma-glutamyltransferase
MKTPPLLAGAALVFWGWQSGLLIVSIAMALVFEGASLLSYRWNLTPSDFNRVSDLCSLLLAGLVIYAYATGRSAAAILVIVQRLPLVVFPLLVAQAFSTSDGVDLSTFFWSMRKRGKKNVEGPRRTLNLTYPYFALLLLSAGAANNNRAAWFYLGLMVLCAWGLWPVRSRRFSPLLWASLIALGTATGYAGHVGLNRLQLRIEDETVDWFARFIQTDRDPYRSVTAIGDISSLKPSDRILFRVRPESGRQAPGLLRQTAYTSYRASKWYAARSRFRQLKGDKDGSTWILGPRPETGTEKRLTVFYPLSRGGGILPLPPGSYRVNHMPALKVMRNQYGAVKVEGGPALAGYGVSYSLATSFDGPPVESDRVVPDREMPAVADISRQLGLDSLSPEEAVRVLGRFFQEGFRYSLDLEGRAGQGSPLGDFLLKTRSGHCEYFATSAALILRAAGIPSRYATGFAVHEFSKFEESFVVRERHAHAWALFYHQGSWRSFDPTPAVWMRMEEAHASPWKPVADLWSWCMFRISKWRWGESGKSWTGRAGWFLIPLVLVLAWRIFSGKRVRAVKAGGKQEKGARQGPGSDSEFYLIEGLLAERGQGRRPREGMKEWVERIGGSGTGVSTGTLRPFLDLHYCYRFDPQGLSPAEREELRSGVMAWLEQERALQEQR